MGKYHQLFPSGWTSLLSSRLNTEVVFVLSVVLKQALACLTCALLLVSVSNAKKKYTDIFFSLMFQHTFWLFGVCLLIRFLFVFSFFFPGLTWAVRTWKISRLIQASAKWDSQRLTGSCLKVQFATRVGPMRLKTQKQSFKLKWRLKQKCNKQRGLWVRLGVYGVDGRSHLLLHAMIWAREEKHNLDVFYGLFGGRIDVRHGAAGGAGGGSLASRWARQEL